MRRLLLAPALVALLVLALPLAAQAKGPSAASISGPGLIRSVAVTGDGELTGSLLGRLTMASGYFAEVFGQTPDPTLGTRPAGALGPRYRVVYLIPGPNDRASRVVQWLYPWAKAGPLAYMKPGQRFWGGRKTHGGWFHASGLVRVVRQAGLPAAAPS